MATKYSWTGLGQKEHAIASGRLAAEILDALPGVAGLSGPARIEAVLAELLASYGRGIEAGVLLAREDTANGGAFLLSSRMFGGASLTNFLTDGPTVAVNLAAGALLLLTAGGSRTLLAPSNVPLGGNPFMAAIYVLVVHNNTGGAITTTFTSPGWKLNGAWVDPAPGMMRQAIFYLRGTDQGVSELREISRSATDQAA